MNEFKLFLKDKRRVLSFLSKILLGVIIYYFISLFI